MTSSIKPEVGLIWLDDVDPTAGAGVQAPLWQFLIQTANSRLWYKTGPNATQWDEIAAGGGIVNAIRSASGGTTYATGPGVSLSNANGVSFGVAGNTITASVAAGTPAAFGANGNTVTAGTVVVSNSNNVSFGLNGSTITATATFSQSVNLAAAAAGSQTQTSGTLVFSNSNGVTFGMSGSSQVTASYSQKSYSVSSMGVGPLMSNEFAPGVSISFAHWTAAAHLSVTQAVMRLDISAGSNDATATAVSMAIAIYTLSQSTASLASSGARTLTWNSGNTTSDPTNYGGASGLRFRTIGLNASITPGDYMVAVSMSAAANITLSVIAVSGLSGLGSYDGIETSQWMDGFSNASTAAFPSSFQVGDTGYVRTGAGANRRPTVTFFGTF